MISQLAYKMRRNLNISDDRTVRKSSIQLLPELFVKALVDLELQLTTKFV